MPLDLSTIKNEKLISLAQLQAGLTALKTYTSAHQKDGTVLSIQVNDETTLTPDKTGKVELGTIIRSLADQSASNITKDTFSADRIPGLNANKITEGVLDKDRIPTLTADKISDFEAEVKKHVKSFEVIITKDAATTPKGVTWGTITGTLEAADASTHAMYYVPSTKGTGDNYDEYMAISGAWEKIGNTDADLTDYQKLLSTTNSNITITGTDNLIDLKSEITVSKILGITDKTAGIYSQPYVELVGETSSSTVSIGAPGKGSSAYIALAGSAMGATTIALTAASCTINTKEIATQEWVDNKFTYNATTKTLIIA